MLIRSLLFDLCVSQHFFLGLVYFMPLAAYISMKTLPDVGARFRTLRKQARKTQRELAAATGMRQEAISRFEAGSASDFSLNKLLTLLQALDLEFDFKPVVRRPDLDDLLAERRGRLDDAKDPS
ncbi:Putative transcriptional regulator [Bordetella bronchiseptica RB50]|uniref:Transcriptional regulator n=2 Tax=Bordetella bronchiseptica TaxID=518 RepID=A0A0H3LMX1_BORBR|nr:XRE family transcriptional regulator [Bordetella bronchiseptica]CAE33214.1 Putative transcriptional regulator [Bordetella bronchiseptica RB50]